MEERFCKFIKELGCTCVTISHRPALMAFHDQVLALDGEGGWSLHSGARSHPTPSPPPSTSSSPHKKVRPSVPPELNRYSCFCCCIGLCRLHSVLQQ